MSHQVLSGVRVLDFTLIVSGPYCTRMLADLGAEVIKIEPPEGDLIRLQPPIREGKSAYFASLNCGKKSMAVDIRRPESLELLRELAARSDVVVENFRPGVMKRLGLDYDALAPINPRLVYCSISGFGQTGPWATRGAYAPMLHAISGFDLVNLSYQNGLDRPLNAGIMIADILGGTHAFGAIQSALFSREKTGRGDYIDLSMMDGLLGMLTYEFQEAQFPQPVRPRGFQPTRAKDGFVMIAAVKPNNFDALWLAIERPELRSDPRFATPKGRASHSTEIAALLNEWASTRTAAECEAILTEHGVPCSRYSSIRETLHQLHVQGRGSYQVIDDGGGPLKVPNPPFQLRNAEARARSYVPSLGADNTEVLEDLLGYSRVRIDALYDRKVLYRR
jgi:CoA:oxalate CoA-transferase